MSANTYWLTRGPGQPPEGPFFLEQIRSMFAAGQVTAHAQICAEGGQVWGPLPDWSSPALAEQPVQPDYGAFQQMAADQDARTVAACDKSLNWMTVGMMLVAMIPGLGIVLGGILYGLYAFIALILCIVIIVKGRPGLGVGYLACAWVAVPFCMIVLQFIGIAIFGATGMALSPSSSPGGAIEKEAGEEVALAQRYNAAVAVFERAGFKVDRYEAPASMRVILNKSQVAAFNLAEMQQLVDESAKLRGDEIRLRLEDPRGVSLLSVTEKPDA